MNRQIRATIKIALVLASFSLLVVMVALLRPGPADPPPDACREAATTLYGHVGKMFDQITQEALLQGGFIGYFEIHSDGEVFPRVWHEFVTACVPPPPAEGGSS